MNCKQGDLVRYVGSNPYNRPNVYGWIGKTIRLMKDDSGNAGWLVNPPIPGGIHLIGSGGYMDGDWVCDSILRPIRDNPGQDETLQWAPVPKKETV